MTNQHARLNLSRWLAVVIALLLAIPAGVAGASGADSETLTEITLLHDTHFLGDFGDDQLNVAHFVALAKRIQALRPNALFVGSGDDTASSVLSSLFYGAHMIEALNAAGLDIDTYGNHEFDYGANNLLDLVAESRFDWVSANVLDRRTGNAFAAPQGASRFVIRELGGVKVGFTGIAPADTPTASKPGPDVLVLDPEAALREVVPQMRAAGAEVVVVLAHESGDVTERLAATIPGVDVYVGDHNQQVLNQPIEVDGAIISRVGAGLDYLGELTLRVAGGKIVDWTFTLHDVAGLVASGNLEPDPTTLAVVEKYAALVPEIMREEIGETLAPLDARVELVRAEESALGNLFADVLRDWAGADVALINGGGLRGDRIYGPGKLTREDIFSIMPFGNYAVKLRLTGAELLEALEHGVSRLEDLEGRFPQVSGLTFAYDPENPVGSRVLEVNVGGAPLDPDRHYTLATYDFLADGGSGYTMFVGAERIIPAESGDLVTSIVIESLRAAGPVAPSVTGRIQVRTE